MYGWLDDELFFTGDLTVLSVVDSLFRMKLAFFSGSFFFHSAVLLTMDKMSRMMAPNHEQLAIVAFVAKKKIVD